MFFLELAIFEAEKIKFLRTCVKPKLEKYESEEHLKI